jgi:hypothetical protein
MPAGGNNQRNEPLWRRSAAATSSHMRRPMEPKLAYTAKTGAAITRPAKTVPPSYCTALPRRPKTNPIEPAAASPLLLLCLYPLVHENTPCFHCVPGVRRATVHGPLRCPVCFLANLHFRVRLTAVPCEPATTCRACCGELASGEHNRERDLRTTYESIVCRSGSQLRGRSAGAGPHCQHLEQFALILPNPGGLGITRTELAETTWP